MTVYNWNVLFLGTAADIDTDETSIAAESPNALLGTYGTVGSPLKDQVKSLVVDDADDDTNINSDNDNFASSEAITVDGVSKTLDSGVVYNATLTYTDGTTATITAVVMQMTDGSLYLAPELSQNADFTAMEAKAIRSLTLDSVAANPTNVAANRQQTDFVACFVRGTRIHTPSGPCNVEELRAGDLVLTVDNGVQTLRWIGHRLIGVAEQMLDPTRRPVRIDPETLGPGLPHRTLWLSQLHAVAICSSIAKRMTGHSELLVRANRLCGAPGITREPQLRPVAYFHLQFDRHELVLAEGVPAESLYSDTSAAFRFEGEPQTRPDAGGYVRPILQGAKATRLVARHCKNSRAFLSGPVRARAGAATVAAHLP